MAEFRKRKLPNDSYNAKRHKILESDVERKFAKVKKRKLSQEITPYPIVKQSVSDVEQELSSNQIVKYSTEGDGNCFFHAVFGDNNSDAYKTDKAQAMRQEWYRFLGQFKSLSDPKMPNALKGHLKEFFEYMLNNIWEMPNVSKNMEELIGEINKKVDDIINKSAERKNALKNKIIEKFSEDEEFRREIYEIIRRSINERNERNVHSPEEQRDLLNIEDLLKKENEKTLCDRIDEELESCAYILDATLTEEKYKEEYVTNNDIILDSVLSQEAFYQTYLEAIQKQGYFVFHGEISILASLSNTEIEAYFEGQEGTTIYKPDLNMINPEYVRKDELWDSKERETIYLEGNHYSRAKVVTHELMKQQQEQEDFLLAKQLQIDEILEYCNLSKDISERAEVEKRFDELLAGNADGKIGDVVGQCINDVQQRIKCLEEPVLSRRCSVEEAHVEKAFHQQQQILAH